MGDKILIVDDEVRVLDALKRQLSGVFEIETTDSPVDALNRVRSNGSYSVIMSDYRMPSMDGIEFLKTIKTVSPNSSRIMLTGQGDLKTVVSAINESNVNWFLEKPASKDKLCEVLENALREYERKIEASRSILSLNKEIIGRRAQQRRLANLDLSTRLLSRNAAAKFLQTWHEALSISGREEALIIVDIDDFRAINMDMGLESAEQILRTIGTRIKEFAGDHDVAGRWDSDSFVITLPLGAERKYLGDILEDLVAFVSTIGPEYGSTERYTVSAGATVSRGGNSGIERVISEAQTALAAAQLAGPASYEVYSNSMLHVASGFAEPDTSDEPFLSPRMHILSGRIVATKIIANSTGLIRTSERKDLYGDTTSSQQATASKDLHRIYEACRVLTKLRDRGHRIPISIDISMEQMESAEVFDRISAALDHFKISVKQLELEIVDGERAFDHFQARLNIEKLIDRGVAITLANFTSTGDAAAHLFQARFDKIKLNAQFPPILESDEDARAFVRWIATLAHERGYELICDGVENEQQFDLLRDCGCDYAEGLFVSELLRVPEFIALIEYGDH